MNSGDAVAFAKALDRFRYVREYSSLGASEASEIATTWRACGSPFAGELAEDQERRVCQLRNLIGASSQEQSLIEELRRLRTRALACAIYDFVHPPEKPAEPETPEEPPTPEEPDPRENPGPIRPSRDEDELLF